MTLLAKAKKNRKPIRHRATDLRVEKGRDLSVVLDSTRAFNISGVTASLLIFGWHKILLNTLTIEGSKEMIGDF